MATETRAIPNFDIVTFLVLFDMGCATDQSLSIWVATVSQMSFNLVSITA